MFDLLSTDRVILSVMGAHAGESSSQIFDRKIVDVKNAGVTFWLCASPAARPDRSQKFCAKHILFLEAASKNGARPTTQSQIAKEFSADKVCWQPLPSEIGPVVGSLKSHTYAFVLRGLSLVGQTETIDLWEYACDSKPVRFRLGASTLLVEHCNTSADPSRAVSRFRRVIAIGHLDDPCTVWLR